MNARLTRRPQATASAQSAAPPSETKSFAAQLSDAAHEILDQVCECAEVDTWRDGETGLPVMAVDPGLTAEDIVEIIRKHVSDSGSI